MKKLILIILAALTIQACKNTKTEEKKESSQSNTEVVLDNENTEKSISDNLPLKDTTFNINDIPISPNDIGDFPFFNAPEGSQYINKPKVKEFDFIVFVTPDSIYEVEGKTFRSHVHQDRKSEIEVSGRYLIKSFEDAITQDGGVKVFEGKLDKDQKDKYKELCTYAGSNGSIDVSNNVMATYIIRREDGNIYIAIDKGRGNRTSIQIVQEKPFVQTITKINSDKIKIDLSEKGKSILHINFDHDKATLKIDGLEIVNEIIKVLKDNPQLKIAINGYTDNMGSREHNQTLSENRALAVKNEIVKAGITSERLTSKGYGQEHPITDNSTEENKAINRRVELVKL